MKAETKGSEMKKERKIMNAEGYFYHPGGDLPGDFRAPKTRGIWRRVASPLRAVYVGRSWAEAWEDHRRNSI